MPYDPSRPHHERYIKNPPSYDPALLERVERDALTLCRALGYDLNTVEFAVEDGVPYAIDFMNPAPDADYHSVGEENFHWIVDAVARLAVERAEANDGSGPELRWAALLGGQGEAIEGAHAIPSKAPAKKSAPKKAPAKKHAEKHAEKHAAKHAAKKIPGKKAAVKKRAANVVGDAEADE